MLRLCSDSSRSYPGRSVSLAIVPDGAASGNSCCDGAEVSRSHSRRQDVVAKRCNDWKQADIESRKTYPAEGPNDEEEKSPNELSRHTEPEWGSADGARR